MTKTKNPWENIPESSQRRIDAKSIHNIFWITDLEGKYGLYFQSDELFKNFDIPAKLKGISLLKRNSTIKGELFNIKQKGRLANFLTLCDDLIELSLQYENGVSMINAIEIRLKRWQQLLKQDRNREMTIEKQMGLFSELSCLRDLISPKVGIKKAIYSWVGADFDKQDFLLDKSIIEIKSYRASKSAKINISSLEQLFSDKEPFLISYCLTISENGESLNDIVQDINEMIKNEPNEISDIFDSKLLEYGFIPELIESEQFAFLIDKIRAFEVSDSFPKITPLDVDIQISNVKYFIDLYRCKDFEIPIENLIINELL